MFERWQQGLTQTLTHRPRLGGLIFIALGAGMLALNLLTLTAFGRFFPISLAFAGVALAMGGFVAVSGRSHLSQGPTVSPLWRITLLFVMIAGGLGGWRLAKLLGE